MELVVATVDDVAIPDVTVAVVVTVLVTTDFCVEVVVVVAGAGAGIARIFEQIDEAGLA